MANVDLKETLAIINSGDWVALRFITADIQKGVGGSVIEFNKCRLAKNRQPSHKKSSSHEQVTEKRKPANHHLHFTLNMELPNKMLRKVHPILITHINNQPVL